MKTDVVRVEPVFFRTAPLRICKAVSTLGLFSFMEVKGLFFLIYSFEAIHNY